MNDDQMRDLFREMRDEPLPADSLARVRMAVAERRRGGDEKGQCDQRRTRQDAAAATACRGGDAGIGSLGWHGVTLAHRRRGDP